jgi:hypothetical protein
MFGNFKKGLQQAESVLDDIIDFSVSYYQENPDYPLNIDNIVFLSRSLRDVYNRNGRQDMVHLFDLAGENFTVFRWKYMLAEVSKRTCLELTLPDAITHKPKGKVYEIVSFRP